MKLTLPFFAVLLGSFTATAFLAGCAGGMNLSGKTPIVGTIRVDPTAACPVPPPVATATAAPAATAGKAVKK